MCSAESRPADQFRQLADSSDYQTILRIGLPLSRALWLEGMYSLRLEMGHIVEEAAARLNDVEAQAQALIDDIGWTLVAMSRIAEAERYICRGIALAESSRDYYLSAKGYRHRAGIEIQRGKPVEALEWLKRAQADAARIGDERRRTEMLAGIRFGQAEAELRAGRLDHAMEHSQGAREMFRLVNDTSRLVKTFTQQGRIAEKKGDLFAAKDAYMQGLNVAIEIDRRDEIIRNHLGLARVAQDEGHWDAAARYLRSVHDRRATARVVFELDDLEAEIQSVEKRQKRDAGRIRGRV